MLRRILITSSILSIAASFSFASGCSSSSGSAGAGSSSGSTAEAGEDTSSGSSSGASGSSSGSGDASGSSSGASGSSSGTGSSSGSSGGDAGPSCSMPASTVPSSEITAYVPVMQVKGACTGTEISTYEAACLGANATQATCDAWFTNDAGSAACQSCLIGPTTAQGDAQVPTGAGGVWFWNNMNLGANFPGCLALSGASSCASAYAQVDECFVAAGCGSCTQSTVNGCETTIFGSGGACASYYGPYMTGCPQSDFADGGVAGPGGPCATDISILSVICGNGSGDGG